MYYKSLFVITLNIFLVGCINFSKREETPTQNKVFTSNETIIPENEKETKNIVDNRHMDIRTMLETMIFDTVTPIKTKFETIFSNTLITNRRLDFKYLNASSFNMLKQNLCESKNYNLIKGFDALTDSIKSNKVNLKSGAIEYAKDDNYTSYKIRLENGEINEYKWKSNEEWLYHFVGYCPDIGYYIFSENEFEGGINDFLINRINGEKVMFIPNFSCNGKYYHKIETDWGYADIKNIRFIIGEELNEPIENLSYEYYPFSSSNNGIDEFEKYPKNAQLIFEDIKWINNGDLIFSFNHFITQENDTLFKDCLKIKLSIKNAP